MKSSTKSSFTNDKNNVHKKDKKSVGTIYDNVFHTMVHDCSSMLIPVINEIFGEDYQGDEEIRFFPNDQYIQEPDGAIDKRITDSIFQIIRAGEYVGDKYLLECQSVTDSSMIVRIFEYNTQSALDSSIIVNNKMTVELPKAAVLYLRSRKTTPDYLEIELITPGGRVSFQVPALKMSAYTLEEIFEKKLYFLIPFYLFNREQLLSACETDIIKRKNLLDEIDTLVRKLHQLTEQGAISAYQYKLIMELSRNISDALTAKYPNVKKEVESMYGRTIETEAKRIFTEGKTEGKMEGDYERMKKDAQGMYRKGLTPEDISEIQDISLDMVKDILGLTQAQL